MNKMVCKKSTFFQIERMIPFDAETVTVGTTGRRSMYGRGTFVVKYIFMLSIKWCVKIITYFIMLISVLYRTHDSFRRRKDCRDSLGRRSMYSSSTLVGARIIHVMNKMVCENCNLFRCYGFCLI